MALDDVELHPPLPPPAYIAPRIRFPHENETSWSTLWNIVCKDDEQKVQKCQDKIQSCLIYSGLLSIMLSIFLVDSLKALQPSHEVTMVELLRQLSTQTQSFSLSSSFANVTAAAPIPNSTFVPSSVAVQVNKAWVASLVISVLGASLALFLKQRLHDYILPNTGSPQDRLRARHCRSHWDIGGFVSAMSLLPQLSMAIFLSGLILRTLTVDRTVGLTTLSIELTTFLGSLVIFLLLFNTSIFHTPSRFFRPMAILPKTFGSSSYYACRTHSGLGSRALPEQLSDEMESKYDLDVLVAIYANHSDNDVFNVIWDALKESGATAEVMLRFVTEVVHVVYPASTSPSASGGKHELRIPTMTLDMRAVPISAYSTILTNVANLLHDEILEDVGYNDSKPLEWTPWMKEALAIILADSPHPLPYAVDSTLSGLMIKARANELFGIMLPSLVGDSTKVTADDFMHIIARLGGTLKTVNIEDVSFCFSILLNRCFSADESFSVNPDRTLVQTIEALRTEIPVNCLEIVGLNLAKHLSTNIMSNMSWYPYLTEILEVLFYVDQSISARLSQHNLLHQQMIRIARQTLHLPANTTIFLRYASGQAQTKESQIESCTRLFFDAMIESTPAVRYEFLANIHSALGWQQVQHPEDEYSCWEPWVRLDVPKTYLLVLKAVEMLRDRALLPANESESEKLLKQRLEDINDIVARYLRGEFATPVSPIAEGSVDEPVDSADGESGSGEKEGEKEQGADDKTSARADAGEESTESKVKEDVYTDGDDHTAERWVENAWTRKKFSLEEIDVVKQCLSLVASLDSVGVTEDASDEEFNAWAEKFDAYASFVNDEVIEALHMVLTREHSEFKALPRMKRIELTRAQREDEDDEEAAKDHQAVEGSKDRE